MMRLVVVAVLLLFYNSNIYSSEITNTFSSSINSNSNSNNNNNNNNNNKKSISISIYDNDIDIKSEKLRGKGRVSLSRKEYESAASFYSAAIQVIEGIGGEKSAELRRRCCLTLAECDLKTGNHLQAIARCSEVIEEAPDINNDDNDSDDKMKNEKLKQALGKAYFRRGLSLQLLEKPQLAILDMRKGLDIVPSDPRFSRHISMIEKMIESDNNNDNNNVNHEEELQDIIEEAQYKYPRRRFSEAQISKLISQKKAVAANDISQPFDLQSMSQGFDFQSMLSQGQGSASGGGLDSLLGGGGLGGLGGLLGGLGGLGGLGALGGGGGIGTLLSGMGVDASLVTQIGEIFTACKDVFKLFKNTYENINKHANHITLGLTVVWMGLAARTIYINNSNIGPVIS